MKRLLSIILSIHLLSACSLIPESSITKAVDKFYEEYCSKPFQERAAYRNAFGNRIIVNCENSQ